MNKSSVFTMLGFAQKAGKIVSGEMAVKALLKKKQVYLLILANDLSENRKKHWLYITKKLNIPVFVFSNKKELGLAIGHSPRTVIGITDPNMAGAIEKQM